MGIFPLNMSEDRKFLVKVDEKPGKNYGKNPYERTLEELFERGYVNVDKDSGPTSQTIAENIKLILGISKAGHSGTLDPAVTGVLLMGLGRATRLMEYMLKSNKEYVCHMYLHKKVEEKKIRDAFKKFTGKILQTPPIVSAVKREEREREIYYLDILQIKDEGQNVLFRVGCQHGTYIRKLCSDIGDYLGVKGQMVELRRTKAGPVREEDNIVSLDKLRNLYELFKDSESENEKILYEKELRKYIRPMEELVSNFKRVYVRDSATNSVAHGSGLAIPGVCKVEDNIEMGDEVAIFTLKDELVAMGIAYMNSKDVMKKKKGAFVKVTKTFLDVDEYPKYWDFNEEN